MVSLLHWQKSHGPIHDTWSPSCTGRNLMGPSMIHGLSPALAEISWAHPSYMVSCTLAEISWAHPSYMVSCTLAKISWAHPSYMVSCTLAEISWAHPICMVHVLTMG